MIQTVHMVCGVPGSGKTWVCEQLTEKFTYLKHDDYMNAAKLRLVEQSPLGRATVLEKDFVAAIIQAATKDKPVLIDCPFAERELRKRIESIGLKVVPWFIVESTALVQERYKRRTGRDLPQNSVTRSATIVNRANEWKALHGKAEIVLKALQSV